MDQATDQEVTDPKHQVHPIIELVRHLTPDTSSKLKERLLPPTTGVMFAIGPCVFKVGYINAGKMQFSSNFYGLKIPGGIMRPGGAIEPMEQEQTKNAGTAITTPKVDNAQAKTE